jgi:hypothetical protein
MKKLLLILLLPLVGASAFAQSSTPEASAAQVAAGTTGSAYVSPRRLKTVTDALVLGELDVVSIGNTMLTDMAQNTLKGRISSGTGDPEDLTASQGRTLLGLVIGTNVQAYDADLTTYAGITPSANIQTFLGAADYAAMRTQLGLVIGTNVQAYDADLTTYAGITPAANVQTFLGAANYAAMRTQLGLVIGTDVQAHDAFLADIAALTDPGADRILFWDDSAGALVWLTAGSGLSITGTTLTASGGGGGGGDVAWGDITGTLSAQTDLQSALDSKQAADADLTTYASITPSANTQSLLAAADYSAMRTLLSLVVGTNVQAYDADLTTYAGITPSANVQTFLGAADYAAMRTQLGVSTASTVETLTGKTLQLNAALGTDDTLTGTTISGLNAGATIAQWEAVYLSASSTWLLADANGSGTYPAVGLAVAAGSDTNPLTVITTGTVRNDAWNWTPGGRLYLSATAGGLTQTAPSTSGDQVQDVGFALTADIAFVDFSGLYVTIE